MADLNMRLDQMEAEIHKPRFRQTRGRANEVNYWVFDYPPDRELEVRERIQYMVHKNQKGTDGFSLTIYDLYDLIIDHLEKMGFMEECYNFERTKGMSKIVDAVGHSMKFNERDSVIINHIQSHTPDNAIVFLTGIGKCYPILRSHKVLNNLHQVFHRSPVVLFFPGTYDERELVLFNEIKDDNYYRAFRLVR